LEQFKNFIIQNSNEYFEGEKMKEDSLIIGKEETKMVRL
jgi:predicted RNA-binding protein